MDAWYQGLIAIDRKTKTLLWRCLNWAGTPVMSSADIDISIFAYRGNSFFSEDDFQSMNAVFDTMEGSRTPVLRRRAEHEYQLSEDDIIRLNLNRTKCRVVFSFLSRLGDKIIMSDGIFPGIHNSDPNGYETVLLKEEARKIKQLVQEHLYEFHDRLWLSETQEELVSTLHEIKCRWP